MNTARTQSILSSFYGFLLAVGMMATSSTRAQAQNLVSNSNFSGGLATGWSTGCSIEIYPQSTYGGPSNSIYVTEIDVQRCLNQQVCVVPGLSYTFTYLATRRPQGPTPASPGLQVEVTGNTSNTNYVNSIQAYTNTTWNMQVQSFTISVPASSGDTKLNIQFLPNNNTTTYGVIIGDIELAPASTNALSINGPTTSVVAGPNNFYLAGSPAAASYNWSFSNDASQASSVSAAPTNISWASMGSKTVSVALTNSVCTMATYSHAINISAILAVSLVNFTGLSKDNDAYLAWTTNNSLDAGYFVIEKSATGNDFDSIGTTAAINTASVYTYNFIDPNISSGDHYYRLRTVNRDGTLSYSPTIVLSNEQANTNAAISVYPNPTTALLNFEINSSTGSEVTVQVFSVSGVLMIKEQVALSAGNNHFSLPVQALRIGNYFLRVSNAPATISFVRAFTRI